MEAEQGFGRCQVRRPPPAMPLFVDGVMPLWGEILGAEGGIGKTRWKSRGCRDDPRTGRRTMKVKALVAAGLLLAGVGAAVAFATPGKGNGPPPGKGNPHAATEATTITVATESTTTDTTETITVAAPTGTGGKPPTSGPGCRPSVAYILAGTLISVGGDSFLMNVLTANEHGQPFVGGQSTIMV